MPSVAVEQKTRFSTVLGGQRLLFTRPGGQFDLPVPKFDVIDQSVRNRILTFLFKRLGFNWLHVVMFLLGLAARSRK